MLGPWPQPLHKERRRARTSHPSRTGMHYMSSHEAWPSVIVGLHPSRHALWHMARPLHAPPTSSTDLAADSQRVHGAFLPEASEISLRISLSRHPSPRLTPPSRAPCVCTRHSRARAASCGLPLRTHSRARAASAVARTAGTRHPTPRMSTSERLNRRGRGCRHQSPVRRRASGSAAAAACPCGRGAHQG